MKQFAEKVSKASVSLGVAGAVLAQVRFRFRPAPTTRCSLARLVSFRTTCRFLFFRCPLDFCRVVNGENTTHSGRESPSGFVCYPRTGWFFPVLHRRNVIHNNIWGNSVMEWMMSPELAAPLRDWGARADSTGGGPSEQTRPMTDPLRSFNNRSPRVPSPTTNSKA